MTVLAEQCGTSEPPGLTQVVLSASEPTVQRCLEELAQEGFYLEVSESGRLIPSLYVALVSGSPEGDERVYRSIVRTGSLGATHYLAVLRRDRAGDWRVVRFLKQMTS